MPPKKSHVYLSDYNDCFEYISSLTTYLDVLFNSSIDLDQILETYDPFVSVPSRFFSRLKYPEKFNLDIKLYLDRINAIKLIFFAMDNFEKSYEKQTKVSQNALECALFDIWSQLYNIPLSLCILNEPADFKNVYYTIGMNFEDHSQMISSALFGLENTPHLKIKVNSNVEFFKDWFAELYGICKKHRPDGFIWTIDANADWTLKVARDFLKILEPYSEIIAMIEQPYPINLKNDENSLIEWKRVKELYDKNSFKIYLDESVSISDDIEWFKPIADGINIKLDKAGGIREALRMQHNIESIGLGVWIGVMVSSIISISAAACMLPLSTLGGDLDGHLLITDESNKFKGGIVWDKKTGRVRCSPNSGLGLY